jgi:hypothetical protein
MTNMRRILSFCTLFTISISIVNAQNEGGNISCSQRLRLARATYEAGRLHELVGTILGTEAQSCFSDAAGAFSKQEKVDALKLIALAYIYLEEPEMADDAMLRLLKTDHFYTPDINADPAEYMALYNTFRTHPVLSFGGKVGFTTTFAHLMQNYPVGGESIGQGKYKPGYSVLGGGFVEKEFFANSKSFLKNTVAMAEVFIHLRPNTIQYPQLFTNAVDGDPSSTADFKTKSTWWDLNLIMRYRLAPKHVLDPYIGLGPGISYLGAYNWEPQTQNLNIEENTTATVTSTAVDTRSAYTNLTYSVTAMGGIKFRFGEIYLNAEARYQFGLYNIVDPKNRTVDGLTYNYHVNINDYRQSNLVLNVGVTYPKFSPKKKKKK